MTTKSFINHRVLWLLIPLLTLFNLSAWGTGTATLPFEWTVATDNSSTISDPSGVTEYSIGRYTSNYPYRLKFDAQGEYLQIDVDAAVDKVIFHVKMVGGTSTSKFKVQGCTTSSGTYSDVEEFTISGSSNTTVVNCTTSVAISSTYRYIRIIKSVHGSNVGLGYVKITKAAPAVKYTVSFNTGTGNPSQSDITEATAGAGITLPSVTPTCSTEGWALYGWATSACASETSTAPTIVGKPGDTYKPESNITLYAVYAKGEYTKITSTSSIDDGGKYLIVASYSGNNYIMTNKVTTDTYGDWLNGVILAETSTNKYHAASVNAAWVCTFTESSSKYYIQNASGGYIDTYYSSSDWYSHTPIDASDKYTITYSSGTFSIVNSYGSNKHLDFYSDGTFGPNDESYGLLLYEAGTISYYSNPTCASCDANPSVGAASLNGTFN